LKLWKILLTRTGTVLVAAGLALLLVSLIPPASTTSFSSADQVPSETFRSLGSTAGPFVNPNFTSYSRFSAVLTPQQELKIDFSNNDTVDVYLLKINMEIFLNTMGNQHSVASLETFLQSNPDAIGWQGEILDGTLDYIPTQIINVTLLFSNPSANTVSVTYDGSVFSLIAPTVKVQTLGLFAIPIGVVLTLPGLQSFIKSRKSTS
jgi:hypothetical protein